MKSITRIRLSTVVLTLGALAAGALAVAITVLYAGFYNVAATHQHLRPTYWLLETGLRESMERHARGIEVPPLGDAALVERGLVVFRDHCAQCHGAPGVAPQPFALGLTPLPKNLAHVARERSPAELYWVVKQGIKMTGMPAWQFRLAESDLWSVVAFMQQLPLLGPDEYAARAGRPTSQAGTTRVLEPTPPAADSVRGKMALRQYACTACHHIPGLVGHHAPVGPPLDRIATRQYIAGMLANTPENMVRWLRAPQQVNPRTAMPNLNVSERDALDMAAYLYTLR
jgi:mono/diheme cytochrome c family protein